MKSRKGSDHRYSISPAGRERRRRADRKYKDKRKARRYGVTPEFLQSVIAKQNGVCPLTGEPITSRSHVDHSHDPGLSPEDSIRGVVDGHANSTLPNDDAGLVTYAMNLWRYAAARTRLHLRLLCTSTRGLTAAENE